MSPFQSAVLLLSLNLGILWLLMAAPVGFRTIRVVRKFSAAPEKIWQAIHPAGTNADWHHSVISSLPVPDRPGVVEQTYAHLDRRGKPIRRLVAIETLPGDDHAYSASVIDDSTLDTSFWKNYRERRQLTAAPDGATLLIEQTDNYRGFAFLLFRYFVLRREMRALDGWIETGISKPNGHFERPVTQMAMAILSTLILWPFFGLGINGLMISTFLTLVIVLHELGHMAAYRTFGHVSVRMIFVPLLGGIAIGGRPYNSLFEVATCALMGAGMSAFLVPILIAGHEMSLAGALSGSFSSPLLIFLLILGAFNLLNLLPMYRFDGGQVLRQICRSKLSRLTSSFGVTLVILWVAWQIHLPSGTLLAALAVFTLLSLIGARSVKPKEELEEMSGAERMLIAFGLYAALTIHGWAIIYAVQSLF